MKKNNKFLSFPDEILLKIFSYLNIFSLKKCAQASKRLQSIALDSSLDYKDNRTMPSLYQQTLCLCVKHLIIERKYKIAKEVERKHCIRHHCQTMRLIWNRINMSENSFAHFTSAELMEKSDQPIEKSKEWHALVKINEREYLVRRL